VVGIVAAVGIGVAVITANLRHKAQRISTPPTTTLPTTTLVPTSTVSTTVTSTIPPTTIPPAHTKSAVTVIVVNAGILPVKAAMLSTTLRQAGYSPFRPVSDDVDRPPVSVTVYAPGYEGDAVAIGAAVGIGPIAPEGDSPIPISFARGAEVMVVIGGDLKA
jgi:hypothetical protein